MKKCRLVHKDWGLQERAGNRIYQNPYAYLSTLTLTGSVIKSDVIDRKSAVNCFAFERDLQEKHMNSECYLTCSRI